MSRIRKTTLLWRFSCMIPDFMPGSKCINYRCIANKGNHRMDNFRSIIPFLVRWLKRPLATLAITQYCVCPPKASWTARTRCAQSLATNSPAPGPRPLTCGVSSECLGTRSYETTSRDQRGKIQMFFSSTGACTAAKFPIANHHSQIITQLYSASLIRLIWQQRHSDSEFDAL